MKRKFNGVYIKPETEPHIVKENTENVLNLFSSALLELDPELTIKYLYWLNALSVDYLPIEKTFNPASLIKYERRDILEVDLGFKIGSEQGGLRYAVVMDCDNRQSSPVLMIVPLKSLGGSEGIDSRIEVEIDVNIFEPESNKVREKIKKIDDDISKAKREIGKLEKEKKSFEKDLRKYQRRTIAQPSQMCALSKIRIQHPRRAGDKLFRVKMPEMHMKLIEDKIRELYFQNS